MSSPLRSFRDAKKQDLGLPDRKGGAGPAHGRAQFGKLLKRRELLNRAIHGFAADTYWAMPPTAVHDRGGPPRSPSRARGWTCPSRTIAITVNPRRADRNGPATRCSRPRSRYTLATQHGGYTRFAKSLRSWAGVLEKRQPAIRAPGVRQATPRVVSLRSVPVISVLVSDIKGDVPAAIPQASPAARRSPKARTGSSVCSCSSAGLGILCASSCPRLS